MITPEWKEMGKLADTVYSIGLEAEYPLDEVLSSMDEVCYIFESLEHTASDEEEYLPLDVLECLRPALESWRELGQLLEECLPACQRLEEELTKAARRGTWR